jgi:acetyl-CoA carboxylase biotin carboxyl carrier protein
MEVGVCAHVPGRVSSIEVTVGDEINEGGACVVLESMGTEMPVEVPASGRVVRITCVPGQAVGERDVLVVLEDGKPLARPPVPAREVGPAIDFDDIEPRHDRIVVTTGELDALEAEVGDTNVGEVGWGLARLARP